LRETFVVSTVFAGNPCGSGKYRFVVGRVPKALQRRRNPTGSLTTIRKSKPLS